MVEVQEKAEGEQRGQVERRGKNTEAQGERRFASELESRTRLRA